MAPAPSRVEPPVVIPTFAAGHIAIPQVPAGAAVPEQARKLSFKLLGLDIQGEFEELAAQRAEAAAPLVGKPVTVAQIFEFADSCSRSMFAQAIRLRASSSSPRNLQAARASSCASSTASSSAWTSRRSLRWFARESRPCSRRWSARRI
jgi:hypothetical protein